MKHRIAAALAMVMLVGACSSAATTAPTPAPTPAPPAATAAPATPAPATPAPATPAPSTAAAPVTITWWHITTGEPGRTIWQDAANAYMAAHPNVKIEITVLENEAFKSKLQTTMQGGQAPDLFQSWGGGTMAAQADAGMLKDITADVASWKDEINAGAMSIYQYKGKQYGIPWDLGMIGFWYNKDLFKQAGIDATPASWDELLQDVDKLKAANIVPYSIAGKDEWPGMHLWTYLVLRSGGAQALTDMVQSGDWNTDACKKGGELVQQLVAKKDRLE